MEIVEKSLLELSKMFQSGKISSREITESFIKNIEEKEDEINSFITKTFDLAREMANASDARFKNNKLLSDIDGMPLTLKDVVCTNGIKTTAGSRILENFTPPYDATVWEKLKNAGGVLLGKVNTDEFTMGSSTESSAFGITKNPHDLSRVPGGSSGGSSAAVAANFCTFSIGTDTGGSIRQPASFCGITGLKVSYGRVSRFGTIPMASSLDTVGVLAKTPEDCAMVLEIIAGKDEKDSTTQISEPENYLEKSQESISDLKIGIPREYFPENLDENVLQILNSAQENLKNVDCEITNISLPHTKYSIPTYYLIASSEISANMARFDGVRFGNGEKAKNLSDIYTKTREKLGDEVKRRILLGNFALSSGFADEFYNKAQKVRYLIAEDFTKAFENVDAILTPVSPSEAFLIGNKINNPAEMYLEDIFLVPSSLAGICGVSVPFGLSKNNLPIGVHIITPKGKEGLALQIASNLLKIKTS